MNFEFTLAQVKHARHEHDSSHHARGPGANCRGRVHLPAVMFAISENNKAAPIWVYCAAAGAFKDSSLEAITWESIAMNRTFAIAAVAIGASWATAASADSPQIRGSYAFTGTAACLTAPGGSPTMPATPGVAFPNAGFNDRLQPIDTGTAFSRSYSVEGIRTFDGHGNGSVKGTVVVVLGRPTPGPTGFPDFPPSASSADFSFQFTYTVDGNGGWSATMVPGTYTETFTSGPRANPVVQTATVDAIPPISGAISNDGKTLIAAHTVPTVETHTFSNGDVWPEICHRSRVFIKLQDADGDNDQDHDHDH
jgi:hypothetical protein